MKLLFVNCCISQRGEGSRTLALAKAFLEAWKAKHPEAEVETVEPETLLALKPFAPDMLNDRDAGGIRCFDAPVYDLARQFRAADRIVVAAPFWDLTFPAALRTYIEYISANGLTYHYEPTAATGIAGQRSWLISPPAGIWSSPRVWVSCTGSSCAPCSASRRSAMCLPADWTWIPPRRRRF